MNLKELAENIAAFQKEIDLVQERLDGMTAKLNEDKLKLIELMNSEGLTSFRTNLGNIILNRRFSVKLPQSPEDWDKLWGYLESVGHKDTLMTINSQKFNAYYKERIEEAKESGDIDFHIPGIGDPSVSEYLSIRR